jgi:hypothetical protein
VFLFFCKLAKPRSGEVENLQKESDIAVYNNTSCKAVKNLTNIMPTPIRHIFPIIRPYPRNLQPISAYDPARVRKAADFSA